jgi:beta-N-acetylhexosaminidase
LKSSDLVPFAAGIEAGAQAILVSHTFVNCLDTEYPASLSPLVIGYLRNEMGFEGVVVTDDLVMKAIKDLYGAGESAVLAVLAGNDLLISSEYEIQYNAVLDAVQTGRIPTEILSLKLKQAGKELSVNRLRRRPCILPCFFEYSSRKWKCQCGCLLAKHEKPE